jgi:D-alanyl-lipoteichoic acid acyltransferase DltB (MBOAT superfamily)
MNILQFFEERTTAVLTLTELFFCPTSFRIHSISKIPRSRSSFLFSSFCPLTYSFVFFIRYNVYSLLNIGIHDSDIDNYCLKIVTIAQNCCHLFFSCLNFYLKFFVKTATSFGKMKKSDSKFRSHSVFFALSFYHFRCIRFLHPISLPLLKNF